MEKTIREMEAICHDNKKTPIYLIHAGETSTTCLIADEVHVTDKFYMASHFVINNFEKLPDVDLAKEFLALDFSVDMTLVLEQLKTKLEGVCTKCVPLVLAAFEKFDDDEKTYGDFYEKLEEIDNDPNLPCKCYQKNVPLRYDGDYASRVEELKTLMSCFMDDPQLAGDTVFIACEYWDGERKKMQQYILTDTGRMAETKIPKYALAAYILNGGDLKQYGQSVSYNRDILEYIKNIS